jgi:antitoxin CcdA
MRIHYAHHSDDDPSMRTRTLTRRRRKKAANLSVDKRLLEQARRLKLNLSRVFEAGLTEAIRRRQREEWLRKNRAALDVYNESVEKHGVFSDGLRLF